MPVRQSLVDEATRRAQQHLDEMLRDLRTARLMAGLSQAAVGRGAGWSRPLVSSFERGRIEPTPIQLARWGSVVGLDVSIRAFPAGSPLRDSGQLRLMASMRAAIGQEWRWRTEVPVNGDPRDRRAIDVVLVRSPHLIGVEIISRLIDAQAQVRGATRKQVDARLDRMILVLADTRHNRRALVDAEPTVRPEFPLDARATLRDLRAGRLPPANGTILL